jgi:hypothetical protein
MTRASTSVASIARRRCCRCRPFRLAPSGSTPASATTCSGSPQPDRSCLRCAPGFAPARLSDRCTAACFWPRGLPDGSRRADRAPGPRSDTAPRCVAAPPMPRATWAIRAQHLSVSPDWLTADRLTQVTSAAARQRNLPPPERMRTRKGGGNDSSQAGSQPPARLVTPEESGDLLHERQTCAAFAGCLTPGLRSTNRL